MITLMHMHKGGSADTEYQDASGYAQHKGDSTYPKDKESMIFRPRRDLNPCLSFERALSWPLDDGDLIKFRHEIFSFMQSTKFI